mmetsp:Transcript_42039/g.75787  ORF Transcript_42039/g.75787 Transcript_42039/m.75787 type:complete len:90 (+) Transcript_42039:112-381(+)
MVANVRPDIHQKEAIVQHVDAKAGEYGRSRERALAVSQGDTSTPPSATSSSAKLSSHYVSSIELVHEKRRKPMDFLDIFAGHECTFFRE